MKYRSTIAIWGSFLLLITVLSSYALAANQPPSIWFTQSHGGVQNTDTLTFKWDASDPDGFISNYYYRLDSSSWYYFTSKSLTWAGISPGPHSFSVKAIDDENAESSVITSSFTINDRPIVNITSGPSGTISTTNVTFTWSGSDSDGVIDRYECKLDSGSYENQGTGTSKSYTNLSEGEHTFYLRCRDNYSYWSEVKTRTFTVDTGSPTTTTTTTTTTTSTSTTSTTTTSTTTTTVGGAQYHLKITNNDDDSYAQVYYRLEKQEGGMTDENWVGISAGQTVWTLNHSITPGTYRSVLRWTDPDKGSEDIYRDAYVAIDAGQNHEFVRIIPLQTGGSTTTTTTTTTSTTTTSTTTTTSSTTTTTVPSISIISSAKVIVFEGDNFELIVNNLNSYAGFTALKQEDLYSYWVVVKTQSGAKNASAKLYDSKNNLLGDLQLTQSSANPLVFYGCFSAYKDLADRLIEGTEALKVIYKAENASSQSQEKSQILLMAGISDDVLQEIFSGILGIFGLARDAVKEVVETHENWDGSTIIMEEVGSYRVTTKTTQYSLSDYGWDMLVEEIGGTSSIRIVKEENNYLKFFKNNKLISQKAFPKVVWKGSDYWITHFSESDEILLMRSFEPAATATRSDAAEEAISFLRYADDTDDWFIVSSTYGKYKYESSFYKSLKNSAKVGNVKILGRSVPLLDIGFLLLDIKDIARAIEDEQYKEGYKKVGAVGGCTGGMFAYGVALAKTGAAAVCGAWPIGTGACVVGGILSCAVGGVIGSEAMGLYYDFELWLVGDSLLGKNVIAPLAVPIDQATDGVITQVGDALHLNWNDPFEEKINSFLDSNCTRGTIGSDYDVYYCTDFDGSEYRVYHNRKIKGPKAYYITDYDLSNIKSANTTYIIGKGDTALINDWQGNWYQYSSGTSTDLHIQKYNDIDSVLNGASPDSKANIKFNFTNSSITQKTYAGETGTIFLTTDGSGGGTVQIIKTSLPSGWGYDFNNLGSGVYEFGIAIPETENSGKTGEICLNISSSAGSQDIKYIVQTKTASDLPVQYYTPFTVNGQCLVEGDYVGADSRFDVAYQGLSPLEYYEIQVISTINDQELYNSGQQSVGSQSLSAVGEQKISFKLEELLPEGEYKILVTVCDADHEKFLIESPKFRASSFFGMSALSGPNPFSPNGDGDADTTKITYQLSADAKIKIRLVDMSGRMIRHWDFEPGITDKSTVGYNEVLWDGKDEGGALVKNGLYLCYILAEAEGELRKAKLQIAVLK